MPAPHLPAANEGVREHQWKHIDDQTKQLKTAWQELKERGGKADQLAILSPYRPENSSGIRALQ
ncbi:hypothetical protein [Marinobacter sp. SS5-14b]|uniref:hypothetical protein n=1 Tax=Marinobacter sp. SS5-14b TaxID=3050456 RepID=UPI0026DF325B|nr:hypothetical protein [Marinobacter sp. SS5-14b]